MTLGDDVPAPPLTAVETAGTNAASGQSNFDSPVRGNGGLGRSRDTKTRNHVAGDQTGDMRISEHGSESQKATVLSA